MQLKAFPANYVICFTVLLSHNYFLLQPCKRNFPPFTLAPHSWAGRSKQTHSLIHVSTTKVFTAHCLTAACTNECGVNKLPAKMMAKTSFISDSKSAPRAHMGKHTSSRWILLSGMPTEVYLLISIILLFWFINFKKLFGTQMDLKYCKSELF